MKAYQDKTSGLWKWGTRGEPKYKTKEEAHRKELEILTDKLGELRKKIQQAYINGGV